MSAGPDFLVSVDKEFEVQDPHRGLGQALIEAVVKAMFATLGTPPEE